jgi:hypothetical protein
MRDGDFGQKFPEPLVVPHGEQHIVDLGQHASVRDGDSDQRTGQANDGQGDHGDEGGQKWRRPN